MEVPKMYWAICDDCPYEMPSDSSPSELPMRIYSEDYEMLRAGWMRSPRDYSKWLCPKHVAKRLQRAQGVS
jgi:hypothetical protein